MNHNQLKIAIVFLLIFFSYPVFAAITIEEVKCTGEGDEYVVISGANLSDSCSVVDLANNTISNESLTKSSVGNSIKLSWSRSILNNSGEEWFKVTCGNSSAEMTYENGDCSIGDSSSGDNQENEDDDDGSSSSDEKKEKPIYYKHTVNIPEIIFAGIPYEYEVLVRRGGGSYSKERGIRSGYYVWNFGDGSYFEFDGENSVSHLYNSPGEYVINFEYYNDFFSFQEKKDPIISWREEVQVLTPQIKISGIDHLGEVVIKNDSDAELDLDNWAIKYSEKTFIFGHKTLVLPNSEIAIANSVTGLDIPANATDIVLFSPEMSVVSVYYGDKYKTTKSTNSSSSEKIIEDSEGVSASTIDSEEEFNYEKLQANVSGAENNSNDNFLWMLIAGVSVLATLVVLIKNRSKKDPEGL